MCGGHRSDWWPNRVKHCDGAKQTPTNVIIVGNDMLFDSHLPLLNLKQRLQTLQLFLTCPSTVEIKDKLQQTSFIRSSAWEVEMTSNGDWTRRSHYESAFIEAPAQNHSPFTLAARSRPIKWKRSLIWQLLWEWPQHNVYNYPLMWRRIETNST